MDGIGILSLLESGAHAAIWGAILTGIIGLTMVGLLTAVLVLLLDVRRRLEVGAVVRLAPPPPPGVSSEFYPPPWINEKRPAA
jgi:hypothetical protein